KTRVVPPVDPGAGRTWNHVARDWLSVLQEAEEVGDWGPEQDLDLVKPWPCAVEKVPAPNDPLAVLLVMQVPWIGGNWEYCKNLVTFLAEINRQRRQLTLTLGIH